MPNLLNYFSFPCIISYRYASYFRHRIDGQSNKEATEIPNEVGEKIFPTSASVSLGTGTIELLQKKAGWHGGGLGRL